MSVFGQKIIIVNDAQIAFDLFEKKSSIYSDRPTLVFGGEMYVHLSLFNTKNEINYSLKVRMGEYTCYATLLRSISIISQEHSPELWFERSYIKLPSHTRSRDP